MLTSHLFKYIGQFLTQDLSSVCKEWYQHGQNRRHLECTPIDNDNLLALHQRYPHVHSLKIRCIYLLQLEHIPWLHLQELVLDNMFRRSNIDPVLQLTSLQKLHINFSIQQEFLDQLPQLTNLTDLILGNIWSITSLQPLVHFQRLEKLGLHNSHGEIEFPDLHHLPLRSLILQIETNISQRIPPTIERLRTSSRTTYSLDNMPDVKEYDTTADPNVLTRLAQLRILKLWRCGEGMDLLHLTNPLEELYLENYDQNIVLPRLTTLRKLTADSYNDIDITPLSQSPLEELTYRITDTDNLDFLLPWKNTLKKLTLSTRCPNLSAITHLQALEELSLNNYLEVSIELHPLTRLRKLRCHHKITILSLPESLREFKNGTCPVLNKARHLRVVKLVDDLFLPNTENLEKLTIESCEEIPDISFSKALVKMILTCTDLDSIEGLACLDQLRVLNLDGLQNVLTLDPLEHLTLLQELSLGHVHQAENIDFAAHLVDLVHLTIGDFVKLRSVRPLANCRKLRYLMIDHYHNCRPIRPTPTNNQLRDISGLEHCRKLQKLHLCDTNVQNIRPVASMHHLEEIVFSNTPVSSVEPLKYLRRLTTVNGYRCRRIMTIKHLQNLPHLFNINFYRCPQLNVETAYRVLGMDEDGYRRD